MALPKLMRDIFANEGEGPLFRKDRIPAIGEADVPSIFVKAAEQTFTDAQKKQARVNIGADAIPPGTMMAYGGKSIPDGWLLCNGATISRTTYAKLFAAIGTAWGAGDGSTTFKLPDADGRVMQGATDASKVGKYLESALPNITGSLNQISLQNSHGVIFAADGAFTAPAEIAGDTATAAAATGTVFYNMAFRGSNCSSIYKSGSNVQPKAFQTLIIIKV